jgi:hypothetical protein
MLHVQEYLLNGKTLEDLTVHFGIKVVKHPVDPLVILNYDQIESQKMLPIVMECRGLVLEIDTWKVVAKAFNRFFNAGEALEITNKFVWEGSTALDKEDGSLILLYNYNGTWRVNTRGSFAEYNIHECGKTWAEFFWEALGKTADEITAADDICLVFEFCSIWNKIVRLYPESKAILLTIFHIYDELLLEFSTRLCDVIAKVHNFKRPESHKFKDTDEVIAFLNEKEESDPTFEGIVVRDVNGLRMKIKSKTYVALHQLKGNDNIFLPKNIIPFILAGEEDEVLTYFPEVADIMAEVKAKMQMAYLDLYFVWSFSQVYEDQKSFAIFVTKDTPVKTPFTGIIFSLRKEHGQFQSKDILEKVWRNSADTIVKFLFK